jgi:hypothetical protein
MFLHNLLNVLIQIANKMGLQKENMTSLECGVSQIAACREVIL